MLGERFAETLAAAQSGDETAFASLWRDVNPVVVRYLRVTAPQMADDVASETWLQVVRDFAKFSGNESAFAAWVLRIARNRAIDWLRAQARRPAEPVAVEKLAHLPALEETAAAALESLGTETALALIASLPPTEAEIVALRVISGLDVDSVARIVGKKPGTVRVATHRGLRRLATALGEQLPSARPGPERRDVTRRTRRTLTET